VRIAGRAGRVGRRRRARSIARKRCTGAGQRGHPGWIAGEARTARTRSHRPGGRRRCGRRRHRRGRRRRCRPFVGGRCADRLTPSGGRRVAKRSVGRQDRIQTVGKAAGRARRGTSRGTRQGRRYRCGRVEQSERIAGHGWDLRTLGCKRRASRQRGAIPHPSAIRVAPKRQEMPGPICRPASAAGRPPAPQPGISAPRALARFLRCPTPSLIRPSLRRSYPCLCSAP